MFPVTNLSNRIALEQNHTFIYEFTCKVEVFSSLRHVHVGTII